MQGPNATPLSIGRYVLYGEIASGGMAAVYFGRMLGPAGFARPVAIKRLHAQFARDPAFVRMLLDEGRLAARIQHPNVVPTLDIVTHEEEVFIVLEYVPGVSLSQLVRVVRNSGAVIPPIICVSIVAGMLQGLHAAHEAKDDHGAHLELVHRDVSPQNALVGADGVVRLIDFGIAKAVSRLQTTRQGELKGKLAYMAPEQVRGEPVTRRTDVYSASIILWEMLTSRRLFEGENEAHLLQKLLTYDPPAPSSICPDVPPSLDRTVLRGLAREPSQRFGSAREMAAHIQACIGVSSPMDVSDWVERNAGDAIREQAARVETMERDRADGPLSGDVHLVNESAATRVLTAGGRSRTGPLARIGLFLRALDNDYQYLQHEDCLAAVKECGFAMREEIGHNDAALQRRQIEDCLHEPADVRLSAILVNPVDEDALRDVAFQAAKAGIGWVSLNRSADYLDELRLDHPEQLFFCVSPEQRQIGRIQGRLLCAFLPEGGDVLYVEGPPGTSSARQRREGTEHEIEGTKIRLYAEHADWTVEGGARAARRWLERFGHGLRALPVVCAQNDGMAIGARSVLDEAAAGGLHAGSPDREKPPIVVIGCDGTPSFGQRLLAENLLSATVVVPPTAGKAVVEFAAHREHRGAHASPASITISVEPLPLRIVESARRGAAS
jgi:ABC-type sugar transport system substrate-binding protein